jgi:hypothetical protein
MVLNEKKKVLINVGGKNSFDYLALQNSIQIHENFQQKIPNISHVLINIQMIEKSKIFFFVFYSF